MLEIEKSQPVMVTSIEQLKQYNRGQIVELPPFAEGQPFYARLQRPSLMKMVKNGDIPNSLVVKANELFANRALNDTKNIGMLTELLEVFEVFADAVFLEPTYKEIKEAGITLTDQQLIFIFSYAQEGVKQLENFRTK